MSEAKHTAEAAIGCPECAWGKVAGCWRCGSRLRLRNHFTLHQWREMLGMQRVAECDARRCGVLYTECTQEYGTRRLLPMFSQAGDPDRARAAFAKATGAA